MQFVYIGGISMKEKQTIFFKKELYTFNLVVLVAILIANIEMLFVKKDVTAWVYLIVITLFTLVQILRMERREKVAGDILVRNMRAIQSVLSILYAVYVGDGAGYALGGICFLIFALETFLVVDVTDDYERTITYTMLILPTITALAFYLMSVEIQNAKLIYHIFVYIFILFYIIVLAIRFMKEFIVQNEEKLFSSVRTIQEIEESNEKMIMQQNKVKEVNMLLGKQKIELQATNEKLDAARSELEIQNEIMTHISSALEIEKLLPMITDSISEHLKFDLVAVVLRKSALTPGSKGTLYHISSSLDPNLGEYMGTMIENNRFDRYISSNEMYIDNEVENGKYEFNVMDLLRSVVIVPFVREGIQIGYLFVGTGKIDSFVDNQGFFRTISAQIMIAINNASLYSKMEYIAVRDGLTNIYNRRHLTEKLTEQVKEAKLKKENVSVALYDIDKFKSINDTYGHLCGDEVIKRAASLGQKHAEKYGGFVGRYGGEEFVMVFPKTDLENAKRIINEFHEDVRKQIVSFEEERIEFRVSVGLTSYPETCQNVNQILSHADWAMYYSKRHGRDQITIDSPEVRKDSMEGE